MLVKTDEMVNKEAAVEQHLELCRFTEDAYPTWDTLSPRRRILILGTGKLAGELCRVVRSQRLGLVEIVGALVGENERVEEKPDIPSVLANWVRTSRKASRWHHCWNQRWKAL